MELLLFGIAKEIIGTNRLTIVTTEDDIKTVGQLKTWIKKQYPQLAALSSVAVAVNSQYAEDDALLPPDSEVAFIPPVSGG